MMDIATFNPFYGLQATGGTGFAVHSRAKRGKAPNAKAGCRSKRRHRSGGCAAGETRNAKSDTFLVRARHVTNRLSAVSHRACRHSVLRSESGFTLIELMITVALVAILAAIAMPSFREIAIRMNVSSTTNDLVSALNTARAEAVKRGVPIAVTSEDAGWTAGWHVAVDDTTSIVTHPAVLPGYSVLGKGTGTGAINTSVVFGATGAMFPTNTSFDFSVCRPSVSPGNAQSRWISVSPSGVIISRRDTTSSPAGQCT